MYKVPHEESSISLMLPYVECFSIKSLISPNVSLMYNVSFITNFYDRDSTKIPTKAHGVILY